MWVADISRQWGIFANGPAVRVSKRYPPFCQGVQDVCYVRVQVESTGRVWHVFLQSRYRVLIEEWRDRGTKLIGAAIISTVDKSATGTGAVSRDILSRSQKTVKVCWIIIVSRCACPGTTAITNLYRVQEQKQKV